MGRAEEENISRKICIQISIQFGLQGMQAAFPFIPSIQQLSRGCEWDIKEMLRIPSYLTYLLTVNRDCLPLYIWIPLHNSTRDMQLNSVEECCPHPLENIHFY